MPTFCAEWRSRATKIANRGLMFRNAMKGSQPTCRLQTVSLVAPQPVSSERRKVMRNADHFMSLESPLFFNGANEAYTTSNRETATVLTFAPHRDARLHRTHHLRQRLWRCQRPQRTWQRPLDNQQHSSAVRFIFNAHTAISCPLQHSMANNTSRWLPCRTL